MISVGDILHCLHPRQCDFVLGFREKQDRLYEKRWRRVYAEEREYSEYIDMGGES